MDVSSRLTRIRRESTRARATLVGGVTACLFLVALNSSTVAAQGTTPRGGRRPPLAPDGSDAPDPGREIAEIVRARNAERKRQALPERLRHPRVQGSLPAEVRSKLSSAFGVAVRTVIARDECRQLFGALGVRGEYALARAVYFSAGTDGRCREGVPAWAHVGHPLTAVCDGFGRLEVNEAAVQVLHEALHTAGLDEWPHDSSGLRPAEISTLVRKRCFR
jgi:hypothetical protein